MHDDSEINLGEYLQDATDRLDRDTPSDAANQMFLRIRELRMSHPDEFMDYVHLAALSDGEFHQEAAACDLLHAFYIDREAASAIALHLLATGDEDVQRVAIESIEIFAQNPVPSPSW